VRRALVLVGIALAALPALAISAPAGAAVAVPPDLQALQPKLLELKIEGGAYVQFVVDTLGMVDTTSFRVISTTHEEFAQSVRDALPGMRFHPAILRSKKVAQLVEQPFMFKIVMPAPGTTAVKPVSAAKPNN